MKEEDTMVELKCPNCGTANELEEFNSSALWNDNQQTDNTTQFYTECACGATLNLLMTTKEEEVQRRAALKTKLVRLK